MQSTRYQVPVCKCVGLFRLSLFDCPPVLFVIFFLANNTRVLPIRKWHRQQAHSTAWGNQLCTGSSCHYPIASCTQSWVSYFCPLRIWLYSSCKRSGRRQPRAERSPCSCKYVLIILYRTDDGKQSEWFDVTQGLRQGCVLSPLLFNVCFDAAIHAVMVRFSEDPGILRDLVHFEEDLGGNGAEVEPLACVWRSVWGMLYADDAGIVSRSALRR